MSSGNCAVLDPNITSRIGLSERYRSAIDLTGLRDLAFEPLAEESEWDLGVDVRVIFFSKAETYADCSDG